MHQPFQKISKLFKKCFSYLPSLERWKTLFRILTKKEKYLFTFFFLSFSIACFLLLRCFYFNRTELQPSQGSTYTEGMLGQPRFINPVLATSDIDRDLVEILFPGLMKYDRNGNIVPNLIKNYDIKEEGKVYEITLKQDIFWDDGERISADDVVFTIKTIQDTAYKSPEITNWVGVDIEKISDCKLIFRLKNSYFPFQERLTVKIIPKHIFEGISAENFALTSYNLQPIGSGPFKFAGIEYNKLGKVESLTLSRNRNYFGKPPYLDELSFFFFENKEELIKTVKKNKVKGVVVSNPEDADLLKSRTLSLYQILMPRYFAVFLNFQENELLGEETVRKALNLAVDQEDILKEVIGNYGQTVSSPILPSFYGFKEPSYVPEFNLQQAEELLKEAGLEKKDGKLIQKQSITEFDFKKDLEYEDRGEAVEQLQECLASFPEIYPEGTISGYFGKSTEKAVIRFQEQYREEILEPWDFEEGTGMVAETTRKKLNEICNQAPEQTEAIRLSLITIEQPFLIQTAELLKGQWEKLGFEIEIKTMGFNQLSRDFIKPREYEMLLFGEVLNLIPDPFPFWHSSRINEPGLNLSLYESEKADEYLENARQAQDFEEMKENLEAFQDILIKDNPAIFLYSPKLLYLVSKKVKWVDPQIIIDPSGRLIGIEDWYINTKRVWK